MGKLIGLAIAVFAMVAMLGGMSHVADRAAATLQPSPPKSMKPPAAGRVDQPALTALPEQMMRG